jgi:hypothetical protein
MISNELSHKNQFVNPRSYSEENPDDSGFESVEIVGVVSASPASGKDCST